MNKDHIQHILYRRSRWLPLLTLLLLGLIVAPIANADYQKQQQPHAGTANVNANIYLLTDALKPIFQDQINQQVANISSSMISSISSSGNASSTDQSWIKQLAGALISPSATLEQLTPQKNGLGTTINLSMYPGDPQPINAAMLVQFSVKNSSTIQVSAQPVAGSAQLATGPLTTFNVPVGKLQSINTTPNCGSAAVNAGIQIPVNFNSSNNGATAQIAPPSSQTSSLLSAQLKQSPTTTKQHKTSSLEAYVEIPNSSLSNLGSAIGSFPISNTWTAKNIRIKSQNNSLVITTDISLWGTGIVLATATSYVQPSAENGKLVMHVTNTTLSVFIFSFTNNSYNQQIETMLNSNLGNALDGQFTVESTRFGGGQAVPCAAPDSLMLQGTTNLN